MESLLSAVFRRSRILMDRRLLRVLPAMLLMLAVVSAEIAIASDSVTPSERPNIVVVMADDWSWPHASILGAAAVQTPNFDSVAEAGLLCENAFVCAPSCTPSRLSILTGQYHWRLKEGDSLGGSLRTEFAVYTDLLHEAGYVIGRHGKGVWPSKHAFRGNDAFGVRYKNFDEFLSERLPGQPFCYWHGGQDPHRPYELGVGRRSGIDVDKVVVPGCLPDTEVVRSDMADYFWEVQRFDSELGQIIRSLKECGEYENTLLVVSGDNGMPFPRCKATVYDQGTRVPLAIQWPGRIAAGRRVTDFISLCDLAPTFLQSAGIDVPAMMTGRALQTVLQSSESGQIEPGRNFVAGGIEKHVYTTPCRSFRTSDYLYIRNFAPETWKTGQHRREEFDFAADPWPTSPGAFSANVDPSPTKQLLRLEADDEATVRPFHDLSFGRPAAEELYDLRVDPDQVNNVAGQREYKDDLLRLRRRLTAELIRSSDPRVAVAGYQDENVEGWPIRISRKQRLSAPQKTAAAVDLMAAQLRRLVTLLPADVIADLRAVPIWISPEYEGVRPRAEYHPGGGWLRRVGRHPKLVECVELTNVAIFEAECQRMPVFLLHELAHAYHHQILGFDHQGIRDTFDAAEAAGIYDAVKRGNGRTEKAYAITDEKEYFAENTEAYFAENDFYPFERDELRTHDPRIHDLMPSLWRLADPAAPAIRRD